MSDPRADVALLVDFTDLRQSLTPEETKPARGGKSKKAAQEPAERPEDAESVAALSRALVAFASGIGRVAIARAYADWTRFPTLTREVSAAHLVPVLVPATEDGDDRSHIRLVVEALEALYAGDEPDAFVLVTGDPTLLPLVHTLRGDGSEVWVVAPEEAVGEELRAEADEFVPLEQVLAGVTPRPARPRASAPARERDDREDRGAGRGARSERGERRERPPHPTPVRSEADLEHYDWAPFVRLIDELEHRLPFVGVRYLVNKVIGPHNCGVEDPRLKRDLINRAVDDGMIEMYPVGNVGDRSDPVTACRLDRRQEQVVAILGATSTPEGPKEHTNGSLHDDDGDPGDPFDD